MKIGEPSFRRIEKKPLCHVHDKVEEWEVSQIRTSVCLNEEPLIEFEGRHYCLFHLPTYYKDFLKFDECLDGRFEEIELKVAEAEKQPNSKKLKNNLYYDFRYVWFATELDLENHTFLTHVDFSSAKFCGGANFRSVIFSTDAFFSAATFESDVDFSSVSFFGLANFSETTFCADAYFVSSTFSDETDFTEARFLTGAFFPSATFLSDTYFGMATFLGEASFTSVTFSSEINFKNSQFGKFGSADFGMSTFAGDTFFDRTRFKNWVSFNSVIFGEDSDVFFRRAFFAGSADFAYCTAEGYIRFSRLRQGKQNVFDFQEAAFEKANRVSFHTVDLFPNWFVNVDSRKFIFTDVKWKNLYWNHQLRNKNIQRELQNLEDRGIKDQKRRLFSIATRQLAVNAEENNLYEDAAKFRYISMETRRLEDTKRTRISRLLTWLYKWTSSYGEGWSWAAGVLIGILFLFTLFYNSPFATFERKNDKSTIAAVSSYDPTVEMNNLEGLVYSFNVALQNPDPKPFDAQTKLFVIFERILAPLQAALLALAIRRKFMR